MIELLKDIMVDFILFSLIEGIIFTKFFQIVGGCKKFKWWEIGILSLVNCIVSQTLPPLVYQLVGLIFMGFIIYLKNKKSIINISKLCLLACAFTIIFETIYAILLEFIFGIDMSIINNKFILFAYLIPLKIFEIIILWRLNVMRLESKFWWGDNIKRR